MEEYVFYFWSCVAFIFGACVGSFLNVVIHRTPVEESLVTPGSHCPKCHRDIRFYDNIPLLSYAALLGRCRYCGEPISVRYPIVELLTAALVLGLFWRWGLTATFGVFLLFVAAMVVVFFIDLDYLIIPDSISLNLIPVGLASSITGLIPWMDWRMSVLGFFVGGAILYIPAFIYEKLRGVEGLGAGDIKLLAMMGAFIGPMGVFFVLFWSSLIGATVGIANIVLGRSEAGAAIPFGPFLATAGVVYIYVGNPGGRLIFLEILGYLGFPVGPVQSF